MNIEHSIKPNILTINVTNNYGTYNAGRSVYLYKYLRNLLGSLYDKFDKFNWILKNAMCETVNIYYTWGTAAQDQATTTIINMTKFHFINTTKRGTK